MTALVEVGPVPATRVRIVGYDAFRGLAVLAMVVDHLALVLHGPVELRLTIGRLAMPAFFLLAGHLCGRRLRLRHFELFALGILLPLAIPFIDSPNVLCWWAIGCLLIVVARWGGVPVWLLAALALGLAANGWVIPPGHGTYDPLALFGLMALGSLIPATAFTWAARAPRWVAFVGSWPITFYVGHLVVLRAVQLIT